MIAISMTVSDSSGHIVLYDTSRCDFGDMPARVSRQATLDGGAVITHSGVSHGDRTLRVECMVTAAQETTLKYIHQNSTSILVSIQDGVFLGAFSDFNIQNGKFKATILIKSKESS